MTKMVAVTTIGEGDFAVMLDALKKIYGYDYTDVPDRTRELGYSSDYAAYLVKPRLFHIPLDCPERWELMMNLNVRESSLPTWVRILAQVIDHFRDSLKDDSPIFERYSKYFATLKKLDHNYMRERGSNYPVHYHVNAKGLQNGVTANIAAINDYCTSRLVKKDTQAITYDSIVADFTSYARDVLGGTLRPGWKTMTTTVPGRTKRVVLREVQIQAIPDRDQEPDLEIDAVNAYAIWDNEE